MKIPRPVVMLVDLLFGVERARVAAEVGDFSVVLHDPGRRTLDMVKELRETGDVDYRTARAWVDEAPSVVWRGHDRASSEHLAARLDALGARADVVPDAGS